MITGLTVYGYVSLILLPFFLFLIRIQFLMNVACIVCVDHMKLCLSSSSLKFSHFFSDCLLCIGRPHCSEAKISIARNK